MKALLKKTLSNNFISATFWVFLGTGFLNFGNYFYHLLMGRMLGVSFYGALESLISLLYILFVPTLALTFVIVKFVSRYKGKKDYASISDFYNYLLGKIILYGSGISVLLILFSPFIKNFLHLSSFLLVFLLSITFLINLVYVLNKSTIQGMSSFFNFSVLSFIETGIKLVLGVILVYLGFRVEGAFASIGIGFLLALFLSYYLIKSLLKRKLSLTSSFPHKKELIKFALPTFVTTLALTSLFTTDVILVRHFLSSVNSGYYSALSVLGKIIYFGASPIVLVIFPMASESHANGEKYLKFLLWGFLITLFICVFITLIYFAESKLMVGLLFGPKYLAVAEYLGLFAIFMSLYSICSLLANFYLSIHKTMTSIPVAVAAISQILLIVLFHENITQVIYVSIIVTFVLLISLLLYYPRARNS